jgi:acetylglutamate kinase
MTSMISAEHRANVLVETLPYIQQFSGQIVVVKYGGNAMTEPELAVQFAEDIALMHSVGIKPVVIHGGGPQIGDLMARLGKETEFVDGLRVTDEETLDIARMVLVGKVNRDIVGQLNRHGKNAVGLSGEDGGLIEAVQRNPELGFVGDVSGVNPEIVESLLAEELIPVISTIGVGVDGQAYNINADTVAAAVAGALHAEKLIYLTDVDGLLRDVNDPASRISKVAVAEVEGYVADGTISGGMIPKIQACVDAVEAGVTSAHMLNGTIAHVLLLEIFTDAGIGTMLTKEPLL